MRVEEALERVQVIPPTVHGVLDYATGSALLMGPKLLDIADAGGPPALIPRMVGAMILGQSALTDYPLGLKKLLPFKTHLRMDLLIGPALGLVPFVWALSRGRRRKTELWLPSMLAGAWILITTLMTQPRTGRRRQLSDWTPDWKRAADEPIPSAQEALRQRG